MTASKRILLLFPVAAGALAILSPGKGPASTESVISLTGTQERPGLRGNIARLRVEPRASEPERHTGAGNIPAWAIRYGAEFWLRPQANHPTTNGSGLGNIASLDVAGSIERVRHALVTADGNGDAWITTPTFAAEFGDRGLLFRPKPPASVDAVSAPASKLEASFRTVSIRRGTQTILPDADRSLSWQVRGNTAQTLLVATPGIIEHHEAIAEGVAVTWVLSAPPSGAGPVVIDAELAGVSYAGATKHGHHFADDSGTARIRIGEVVAVDSGGQRWPLKTAADERGIRVTVPESVLLAAAYPLALDPWISPEFGMDAPVLAPAAWNQFEPAVAFNGSVHFVTWRQDAQEGTAFNSRVIGARIGSNGELLDPEGVSLALAVPGNRLGQASVAAQGTDFMVVWDSEESAIPLIGAALIDATGSIRTNFIVSTEPGNVFAVLAHPVVAAGGGEYLVGWERQFTTGAPAKIVAVRVAVDGTVLDPAAFLIVDAPNVQEFPAAAFNGQNFLLAWQSSLPGQCCVDIAAARITPAGAILDPDGITVSHMGGGKGPPVVASAEGSYLVAWADSRDVANASDVYGGRIKANGTTLDGDGFKISGEAELQLEPAIGSDGHQYFVVWTDRRVDFENKIFGARVTPAGQVLDANAIRLSGPEGGCASPAVTVGANGFLAVWQQNIASTRDDIAGALVPVVPLPPLPGPVIVISKGPNSESAPAVASNGRDYLVAWQDNRNQETTGTDIYGVRLAPDGTVLDPAGLLICVAPGNQSSPAAAASGLDYLVSWRDERNLAAGNPDDIYARLFRSSGAATEAFAVCTATNSQRAPAVAGSADGFLVVWRDDRTHVTTDTDIYGAMVNTAGQVSIENGFAISTVTNSQQAPVVASNGTGYLVAWRDSRNLPSGLLDDIYASFVSATGVAGTNFPVCVMQGLQRAPDVAASGSSYLVVWRDDRGNKNSPHAYASRVTVNDGVLDPNGVALSGPTRDQREPAVAPIDGGWFVAWHESRNTSISGLDLYGTKVGMDGKPVSAAELLIGPDLFDFEVLTLTSRTGSELLLVSNGARPSAPRVEAHLLDFSETLPVLGIARHDSAVRLHWPVSPRFPARVGTVLTGPAFGPWIPLPELFHPVIAADGLTAELDVGIDPTATAQSFFRLYSE